MRSANKEERIAHDVFATVQQMYFCNKEKEIEMSHPIIDSDECIGCGICVEACPQEVLEVVDGVAEVVKEDACIACGDCEEECPMGAIPEIVED